MYLLQFRKNEEALYTSFPIPIIIKEELEETLGDTDGKFAVYGNVHFLQFCPDRAGAH